MDNKDEITFDELKEMFDKFDKDIVEEAYSDDKEWEPDHAQDLAERIGIGIQVAIMGSGMLFLLGALMYGIVKWLNWWLLLIIPVSAIGYVVGTLMNGKGGLRSLEEFKQQVQEDINLFRKSDDGKEEKEEDNTTSV